MIINEQIVCKLAKEEDVSEIIQLIQHRIEWMNKVNISQWNHTNYLEKYPFSYFLELQKRNVLYIAKTSSKNETVGAFVLFESDSRWKDDIPSLYLHNFVTKIGIKNVGRQIIDFSKTLALQLDKNCLRLDCAQNNEKLNKYYEALGFLKIGEIDEGLYKGYLRQLDL